MKPRLIKFIPYYPVAEGRLAPYSLVKISMDFKTNNFWESHCTSGHVIIENMNCIRLTSSPNGRFLVHETFPKTLPRPVLIFISLQRWQHRAGNETKHFVSPHLIGPQLHQLDLALK